MNVIRQQERLDSGTLRVLARVTKKEDSRLFIRPACVDLMVENRLQLADGRHLRVIILNVDRTSPEGVGVLDQLDSWTFTKFLSAFDGLPTGVRLSLLRLVLDKAYPGLPRYARIPARTLINQILARLAPARIRASFATFSRSVSIVRWQSRQDQNDGVAYVFDGDQILATPFRPIPCDLGNGARERLLLVNRGTIAAADLNVMIVYPKTGTVEFLDKGAGDDGSQSLDKLTHALALLKVEHGVAARTYLATRLKPFLAQNEDIRGFVTHITRGVDGDERPAFHAPRGIGLAIDTVISDPAFGTLVAGWIVDPDHEVTEILLASDFYDKPIAMDEFVRSEPQDTSVSAPQFWADLPAKQRFVARFGQCTLPVAGARARVLLRLPYEGYLPVSTPGAIVKPDAARDAWLACLARPETVDPPAFEKLFAAPLSALHRAVLSRHRVASRRDLNNGGSSTARTSIIIPLYKELGFIRSQLLGLFADPRLTNVEILFVLDSPEDDTAAWGIIAGMARLKDIPISMVTLNRNFGFAAAVNTGVEQAVGREVVLLNSDVIPARNGWLTDLRSRHRQAGGNCVVGPKLLFADESIQHAGIQYFQDIKGLWRNRTLYKGFPDGHPGSDVARRVPAVTGACVFLAKNAYEAVGGMTEDFLFGDFEDTDFCHKMMRAGHQVWYEPKAVLYHFERLSIRKHPGHRDTMAGEFNRWLHENRWKSEMTDCLASYAEEDWWLNGSDEDTR